MVLRCTTLTHWLPYSSRCIASIVIYTMSKHQLRIVQSFDGKRFTKKTSLVFWHWTFKSYTETTVAVPVTCTDTELIYRSYFRWERDSAFPCWVQIEVEWKEQSFHWDFIPDQRGIAWFLRSTLQPPNHLLGAHPPLFCSPSFSFFSDAL